MSSVYGLRNIVTLFIATVFLSLIYPAPPVLGASATSFRFAITKDVENMFPEIMETFEYLSQRYSAEIELYKKSTKSPPIIINSREIRKGLKKRDFNVVVATSSELESSRRKRLKTAGFRIEDGRKFEVEFFLAGFVSKPLSNTTSQPLSKIEKAKIAHAYDQSLVYFYRDIIAKCIYGDKDEKVQPEQFFREEELERMIQELDIFILKRIKKYKVLVGEDLIFRAKDFKTDPTYPVHYYDKEMGEEERSLKSCLERHSRKSFSSYSTREYQKPPEQISEIYEGVYLVQAIKRSESVVLVYPFSKSTEFKRVFWDRLYAELNQVAKSSREGAGSEPDRISFESYVKALNLLTSGIQGILSVANVEFERAMEDYTVLDNVHGVRRIRRKLKNKKPMLDPELAQIRTALDRFKKYYEKRSELPREKVDYNLLNARLRVIGLTRLLHKHYGLRPPNGLSKSEKYLSNIKDEINKLAKELQIVETSKDFKEYETMRNMGRFGEIKDKYKNQVKEMDN